MKFVKKLFGLQSGSTEDTNPIKQLTTADLVAIAKGEQEPGSALNSLKPLIESLSYGDELITIATSSTPLQPDALKRIAALLDANDIHFRTVRGDIKQLEHLLQITSCSQDAKLTDVLLAEINSEQDVVELCRHAQSSQLRQKLVARVENEDLLKMLAKELKSRDKTSYRLIRTKLDDIKHATEAFIAERQSREDLYEKIRAHSARDYYQDYRFHFASLQRKFEQIAADAPENWQNECKSLLLLCQNTIDKATEAPIQPNLDDKVAETIPPLASAPEPQQTFDSLLEKLCHLSTTLLHTEFTSDTIQNVSDDAQAALIAIDTEWQSQPAPTTTQRARHYQKLKTALEDFLTTINALDDVRDALLRTSTEAPSDSNARADFALLAPRLNKLISATSALGGQCGALHVVLRLQQLKEKVAALQEAEHNTHRHITSLIRKASYAVNDGHLKRAQGIRFSAAKELEQLAQVPEPLQRQWDELIEKVQNLEDWHSYAATPKLQELVEHMQKLAESPLSPELQATKIKALQADWRSISKGSADKHEALWQQFKQAADIAFKPCQQHYDELDEIRQQNTEKRNNIIQQLTDYTNNMDWGKADWTLVEKLLRSVKKEWQECLPVFRNKQKSLQDAFNHKIADIQSKLDAEYDKNKIEKERLINSLEPLTRSNELAHAIDVAITFQKQWKTIGRCRHRDDEKLWKQFRAHCDAIFAKRDAERAAEKSVTQAKITEAEEALSALQKILDNNDEEFLQAYRDSDAHKQQFEAVEGLPKPVESAMQTRLRKITGALDKRFNSIQNSRSRAGWDQLFTLKSAIHEAQAASDNETLGELKTNVEALTFKPGQCQKSLLSLIDNDSSNNNECETRYRLLCIQSEVSNNTASPEEDKALRMQYQVEQLQSGLGQQQASAQELVERWLATPAILPEKYAALNQRFLNSLNKLL